MRHFLAIMAISLVSYAQAQSPPVPTPDPAPNAAPSDLPVDDVDANGEAAMARVNARLNQLEMWAAKVGANMNIVNKAVGKLYKFAEETEARHAAEDAANTEHEDGVDNIQAADGSVDKDLTPDDEPGVVGPSEGDVVADARQPVCGNADCNCADCPGDSCTCGVTTAPDCGCKCNCPTADEIRAIFREEMISRDEMSGLVKSAMASVMVEYRTAQGKRKEIAVPKRKGYLDLPDGSRLSAINGIPVDQIPSNSPLLRNFRAGNYGAVAVPRGNGRRIILSPRAPRSFGRCGPGGCR